ncbi:MAG: hypothetical protein A3F13_02900 [Gammaproteobacteria bacterium RIFCSPHIGHO2_12_FULL_40_19]|nr:MAG: hypothetical protein A3F13_02900 [Gammaproteobacteria bacterium RIFCSPHIGHO2_12_FULL_40_19]
MSYLRFMIVCLFYIITSAFADVTPPIRDPFLKPVQINNLQNLSVISSTPLLKSVWVPLYFAQAENVVSFITNKSSDILSPLGKINFDKRSNQVWIKEDAEHITQILDLIHHLDQPSPQFLIRAKVINVDRQYQKSLGVLFRTENPDKKPVTALTMNEPDDTGGAGEFTVTIAKLAGNHLLDLQLSALEQEGHAVLISSPALTTLENQAAVIESGAEVPYQEATSSGATNVSFKKAVLKLQVTPQRMPNNHILLHIALNQDKVSALTVNGVPAIETQQLTTQVIVKNDQTIVLGGILETAHAKQQAGIPIIDDIPVIGELFRHHQKQTKQQELLIFITPAMMKSIDG